MKRNTAKQNTVKQNLPAIMICLALFAYANCNVAAAQYQLTEASDGSIVVSNKVIVQAQGTLETPGEGEKKNELPLKVNASVNFLSRRLPSAGRDARAYRELRQYNVGSVTIEAGKEKKQIQLPKNFKKAVAEGKRSGVQIYAPELILTRNIADLLNTPADPVSVLALLPAKEVKLDETWSADSWAVSMLTSIEAAVESKMTCKLVSVKNNQARVDFEGTINGAITGAETEISLSGYYLYDLKGKLVTLIDLTQKEKRSVGTVSPGMNVTARAVVQRAISQPTATLSDEAVKAIPLDPGDKVNLLTFQSMKWKIRFFHDRDWFIFQEVPQVVVLRLVDKGNLIAQCNGSLIGKVAPGKHTPEQKFQNDIRQSLGENMTKIVKADEIKLKDANGRFIYRVIVEGKVNETPMLWHYYLCAAPDGRQASFVFAVEPKLVERMNQRDLGIITSLQFFK